MNEYKMNDIIKNTNNSSLDLESLNKDKTEQKIEELLESPGWRHRKNVDNIDLSPFDPYSPDLRKKKKKKVRNKQIMNSNVEPGFNNYLDSFSI